MILYILYWYILYIFISMRYFGYCVLVCDFFDNVIKLFGVKVLINKVIKIYVFMINEDWVGFFEIYRRVFIFIKNFVI